MEGNKEDYYSLSQVVKIIKGFFAYILKKWLVFVLVVLAGALLGFVYYKVQKPKYVAACTFVLEEKSSGGSLSGLASQFGLNIGGLSGGGSLFAGDNILDILRSKRIVQQVLLTRVDSTSSNSNKTLADLYLEFNNIKKGWEKLPALANIEFGKEGALTPVQDSVLNVIYMQVVKKNLSVDRANKQSSIISVVATAKNSLFARLVAERLVTEAAKLYMSIKTGMAEANIRQLQNRSDSLLILLNRKSFAAAAVQPLDINPAERTLTVPTEIASRDKTVIATLYAEVTKNLEASKVLLSQQAPVIQILDQPTYLLNDNKKGLFFLVVVAGFIAGFLYVAGAFFLYLLSYRDRLAGHTPVVIQR